MSFLSELKVFGMAVEKAFAWFGSPKGKTIVGIVEAGVEAEVPAAAPIVDAFNAWAQKVYNIESIAVAAGQAKGTGPDKAAAVLTAVAPDVADFEKAAGVSTRTAAQLQAANNAVVAFINAMTQPAA